MIRSRGAKALAAILYAASLAILAVPAHAQTIPAVTIFRPEAGHKVADVFSILARVQGTYEISSVTATVSGISVALTYSSTPICYGTFCSAGWAGQIDITSVPRGPVTLVVSATDAMGNIGSSSIGLVHDNPPAIQVSLPKALSVARPRIAIAATCSDDDPAGCVSLVARVDNGSEQTIMTGTASVAGEVDLVAYDGTGPDIVFYATDSVGQVTSVTVPIFVDRSTRIRKMAEIPGEVWDADATRILYRDYASRLFIRDQGIDTLIHPGSPLPTKGFLTPAGAAFRIAVVQYPYFLAKSWEGNALVDLGDLNSIVSFRGKGRFLAWANAPTLFRRDVLSHSTITVTGMASNAENDVAANGAVSFWSPSYNVYLYKPDGTTEQVTFDTTLWNVSPRTDGTAVAYLRVSPCCASPNDASVVLHRNGIDQTFRPSVGSPDQAHLLSNGWMGFLKKGPSGVLQAWRVDPMEAQAQLSFFGTDSWLESLADSGTLIFKTSARRYMAGAPGSHLVDVSSALGRPFFVEGAPRLAIGNTLFAIHPVPPTPDFNADVKSDLLWRNGSTGQVYRMLMDGFTIMNGAFALTESDTNWKVVGDGDFNGDGVTDLLWRNSATGLVWIQFFDSSGMPSSGAGVMTEANPDWKIVGTPDLDGDGKADMLWWNSTTGQVFVMRLNGTSIIAQGTVYTEPNTAWQIASLGDFAGSGKMNQLVWRNASTGHVYLMTVNVVGGSFTQSGQMIYQEPDTAWKILAAADFNGDGKFDLLWRNDATGQVYVMLMNGPAIASQGHVYQEPNLAWKIVAQGDYNGDGKADLLWRNESTGQVYMMLMNGLSIASQAMVYTEPNMAWKILGPWEYAQ